MESAVKRIAELADDLRKQVEKTPRHVISASVIDQANKLLGLIQHVREMAANNCCVTEVFSFGPRGTKCFIEPRARKNLKLQWRETLRFAEGMLRSSGAKRTISGSPEL